MILIDEVLVSNHVVESHFVCALESCKGACCWEGDMGAPLEDEEVAMLQQEYPNIRPFLTEEGQKVIQNEGPHALYKEDQSLGTPLINGGACAYMTLSEQGIARCGIEDAFNSGATVMNKPISCHLYPVRIEKMDHYDAVNYDRWDICSAACSKGKREQVPLYVFVKEALIRKYGEGFYRELDEAAGYLKAERLKERSQSRDI